MNAGTIQKINSKQFKSKQIESNQIKSKQLKNKSNQVDGAQAQVMTLSNQAVTHLNPPVTSVQVSACGAEK